MSNVTDSKLQLLRVLVELARELPPGARSALISALESGGGSTDLGHIAATHTMSKRLLRFRELCAQQPEISGQAIALALQAASEAVAAVSAEYHAEIAWTGPATEAVPLRRVDQVIYDMVETAEFEILLVTYAAYNAKRALKALRDAMDRKVHLNLVIELAQESGGKITFDGLQAFREAVPSAQIYYWPLDQRKLSTSGSSGAMHAKCLVADRRRAIVSSANLTDHALKMNMELGLLLEGPIAVRLSEHFEQLILRGILIPAP